MKLSKYAYNIKINNKLGAYYSVLSRRYVTYDYSKREKYKEIVEHLNKSQYTPEEVNFIRELHKYGIIVDEKTNEEAYLKYRENAARFRDQVLRITVFVTTGCNFRCTYCTQCHTHTRMTDETKNSLIKYIENVSLQKKRIEIVWFGGEPLVEFQAIIDILSKAKSLCGSNGCSLVSYAVTNGYLLTKDRIEKMKEVGFEALQITVDINKKIHDSQRVKADGSGTYDRVVGNLIMAAENGINVTLRMNIAGPISSSDLDVLRKINPRLRNNIWVDIANVFQNEKNSTYPLLKKAIKMKYSYGGRFNNYSGCTTCGPNSMVVNTNGDILFCSNADELSGIGVLNSKGIPAYKNEMDYNINISRSLTDIDECRNCPELPLCLGRCYKALLPGGDGGCLGKRANGMSVEETAKLDYFYDLEKGAI